MRDRFIALMVAVSVMCGVLSLGYAVDKFGKGAQEGPPRPPTCIEVKGPVKYERRTLTDADVEAVAIRVVEMMMGVP